MDKLTIVKVLSKGTPVSAEDIERWGQVFAQKLMTPEEAEATGEVAIEYFEPKDIKHQLVLVRLGGNGYQPSIEDLQQWRDVFDEAAKDPDFKIFTHENVSIEVIDLGNVVSTNIVAGVE